MKKKEYIIKDLYVLELIDRIKIGISSDTTVRLQNIKTGSGIANDEIVYEKVFKSKGNLEGKFLRLFSKYKSNGEWFYKKGLILKFLEEIKKGKPVSYDLISRLELKDSAKTYRERCFAIFKGIKLERAGIGFPESPNINRLYSSKKVSYKNMLYLVSDDYLTFERKLKFDLNKISNSQKIECLRIIKHNTTQNPLKKERLQELIDNVFNNYSGSELEIISIIENFFLLTLKEDKSKKNNEEKIEKKVNLLNLNFKYDNLLNCHYIDKKQEPLNIDEEKFIKKGADFSLGDNFIIFNHSDKKHFIHFDEEYYKYVFLLLKPFSGKLNTL
ncbi:hypothetical protein J2Q11_08580 [Tenacibaculum finnmarkense genomovar finnmarkense]|uniref:GIY-YIG nuclease family protein n=5 Tax=Tenacibaculum finnmarkense TaxID=2781243 RepID=UPI00187B1BAD|nr:GIY-YIG nuclease family protein [Tenacibaculum finnmarkense]MCD8405222.1 hypothetical protein [Tenacibaculum dicentrarchi]MBE7645390.1 hypothetical protein [Tenacibaculum finnmarkense genomovar ulcerans]MCD8414591.1 hypothetical protein [Tenacibaculum dicentrarchi]MCD8417637.1 hypothetical protein [Tenacibaculum finnmarkense genomovar finnmarkense]MCD8419890.1 hypothetical protein [Tenacibaculum dicentrarchi]